MTFQYLNANKNPKNGLYEGKPYDPTVKPYKPTLYKPKPYVDPLKNSKPVEYKHKEYKPPQHKYEYKPYTSFHVYKAPDIDPLTGKPRKRRIIHKKEPPPPKIEPAYFPGKIGSSVGSLKRTFKIQQDLRYV